MDQSLELLCSMSPKIVMKKKTIKKGPTILALKKNVRRSSIYEKLSYSIKNEDCNIVERNSTESISDSADSVSKSSNKSPIIISDTDDSLDEPFKIKQEDNCILNFQRKSQYLPSIKIDEIRKWIADVDTNKEIDSTMFSELSAICGDTHFKPKEKGDAINSTFADTCNTKFNDFFVNKHRREEVELPSNTEETHEKSIIIIEDSFVNTYQIQNRSLRVTEKDGQDNIDCDHHEDLIIEDSFVDRSLKNEEEDKHVDHNISNPLNVKKSSDETGFIGNRMPENTPKIHKNLGNSESIDEDLEAMLDSFYGNEWRKKQHLIIPRTEPRNEKISTVNNIPKSERQPKVYLSKNSYLEKETRTSDSLLKSLQKSRVQSRIESPCLAKLREICDPETDSSSSPGSSSPVKAKERLRFSDTNDDNQISKDKKSEYFGDKSTNKEDVSKNVHADKENIDLLNLGEPIIKEKTAADDVFPSTSKKKPVKKKEKKPDEIRKKKSVKKQRHRNRSRSCSECSVNSSDDCILNKKMLKKKVETEIDLKGSSSSISSDDDEKFLRKIKRIHRSSLANGTYSFLESLSGSVPILHCDMSARIYRKKFSTRRNELLERLFKLYNEHIFENAIPADTTIEWNDRMRQSAGFCYCKKITRRNGNIERTVRIVLSSKVIDAADRLRDTLVHEMCHAATWIVNCISDGHGSYWKAWAFKAMKTFPELPPIKRCHEYVINTKYTYRCTGCGYSIGRHSKSLDIERKRCGYCYGVFEVLINKITKSGESRAIPSTPRKANQFALFVKDNYGVYKSPSCNHGEVMKILSKKFKELKVKK